jgi:hypothetical protein
MSTSQPKQVPNINLPKGSQTCEISIVDTTCNLVVPPATLIEPHIPGHEWLNLPTVAFYIKHSSGAQVLFDMGCRSDWENLVPHVAEIVSERVPGLRVDKDVPVILKEGGVDPNQLKALILSHWYGAQQRNPLRPSLTLKSIGTLTIVVTFPLSTLLRT